MTEIEFHFNVPDKLAYSCRLLRKVYRSGNRAVVVAEPEVLGQLDALLWNFSATEFLPHCRADAAQITLAATPLLLTAELSGCPSDSVLINLAKTLPDEFERFERFIEVVSGHDEDRILGRRRWKHYQDRGYALKRHDLSPAVKTA